MTSAEVLDYVLTAIAILTAIAGAFGLGPKLRKWIDSHVQELKKRTGLHFLSEVLSVAEFFVARSYKTVKAMKAENGGKLSEADVDELKASFATDMRAHFGLGTLAAAIAKGAAEDVDDMLDGIGETAVLNVKARGRLAKKS